MSLIGVIRQYVAGTATLADVESKIKEVAETGALDALADLESFGSTFLSKFAPAEAQSVGAAGVSLLTGASASTTASTLLQQTETNAETAAQAALSSGS